MSHPCLLHVRQSVPGAYPAFANRSAAGRALAEWIAPEPDPDALVFALPRGGVPVARPLAHALRCPLHPVLVRKLPIPASPEMGFGAITADGSVTLNRAVVASFGIDSATIDRVAKETLAEVKRRSQAYPGGWPLPGIEGRSTWLVDDGLATGFSAIAAARMIRSHGAGRVALAVPCAPRDSVERLMAEADEIWCAIVQTHGSFAVASFYYDFRDMTDAEVVAALAPQRPPR